jgi:hypothetical protein
MRSKVQRDLRAEELPPFDKGGQGGFIGGRHETSNPPSSPFFKGGRWRTAMAWCDCGPLFVRNGLSQ